MELESTSGKGICCALAAIVTTVVVAYAAPAQAAVRATSEGATIQLPAPQVSTTVSGGDFSILMWLHPDSLPEHRAAVVTLPNSFNIDVTPDGSVEVSLYSRNPKMSVWTMATAPALQAEAWALIALSFDAEHGHLSLTVQSSGGAPVTTEAVQPGFQPIGSPDNLIIGATMDGPALVGTYGLLAVRHHALSPADFETMFDSAWYYAPFLMDADTTGGLMTGESGCRWMIGHSVTTRPQNGGVTGGLADRAAVVDEPVNTSNLHVYDVGGPFAGSIRVVRPVTLTSAFVHTSPFDFPTDGFFVRTVPQFEEELPEQPYVAGDSPLARQLAFGPEQPTRIITSANSRGVQMNDGSMLGAGNYASGFQGVLKEHVAGILNHRARPQRFPTFGFNTADSFAYTSGSWGTIGNTDFSRFWTNSGSGGGAGPGQGLWVFPGGTFTLRSEPYGLMLATEPLVVQAHVLKFPGASELEWAPNHHTQQGQYGEDANESVLKPLDTLVIAHTFDPDAGDIALDHQTLAIAGDLTGSVKVGDACVISETIISVVESIQYESSIDQTIVTFEHPLGELPEPGSTLRFGPWDFTTVSYTWPGLDPDDDRVWRGLRLTAGEGGLGMLVFSLSAWRPDVNGFIIGTAGWGGNGYTPQIEQSFSQSMPRWIDELAPDLWLQAFAQQSSGPSAMRDYAEIIRKTRPETEIVWLGDIEQNTTHFANWHQYILTEAEDFGVIALSLLRDERLGAIIEHFADGLKSNNNHYSQRGVERLAEFWIEQLEVAARSEEPVLGDLTGDGSIGVADLLILLSQWGACPDPKNCPADLTNDGSVGVLDLLLLLGNWS